MKNTRTKKKFMRVMGMPINMLVKAGDLFLKTMNEYEKSVGGYGTTASWGGGAMWGLQITESKPQPKSCGGNSIKESPSIGKNKGISSSRKDVYGKTLVSSKELGRGGGKRGGKVSPLKGTAAMGLDGEVRSSGNIVFRMEKIEEEEACEFGDEAQEY